MQYDKLCMHAATEYKYFYESSYVYEFGYLIVGRFLGVEPLAPP